MASPLLIALIGAPQLTWIKSDVLWEYFDLLTCLIGPIMMCAGVISKKGNTELCKPSPPHWGIQIKRITSSGKLFSDCCPFTPSFVISFPSDDATVPLDYLTRLSNCEFFHAIWASLGIQGRQNTLLVSRDDWNGDVCSWVLEERRQLIPG